MIKRPGLAALSIDAILTQNLHVRDSKGTDRKRKAYSSGNVDFILQAIEKTAFCLTGN